MTGPAVARGRCAVAIATRGGAAATGKPPPGFSMPSTLIRPLALSVGSTVPSPLLGSLAVRRGHAGVITAIHPTRRRPRAAHLVRRQRVKCRRSYLRVQPARRRRPRTAGRCPRTSPGRYRTLPQPRLRRCSKSPRARPQQDTRGLPPNRPWRPPCASSALGGPVAHSVTGGRLDGAVFDRQPPSRSVHHSE